MKKNTCMQTVFFNIQEYFETVFETTRHFTVFGIYRCSLLAE